MKQAQEAFKVTSETVWSLTIKHVVRYDEFGSRDDYYYPTLSDGNRERKLAAESTERAAREKALQVLRSEGSVTTHKGKL